jgi:uncharacterized membrane protein HdeD (DUF308 family)
MSTSLIGRGVLAVVVGLIAAVWPGITVSALVIIVAVYAFADTGLELARAFGSRTATLVTGHLLLALIDVAAGIVALGWPGPTALVLVIVVAAWSFASGLFEMFAAAQNGAAAGTFLDCAGLNMLLATCRRAQLEGGWIRLIEVPPQVRRIISLVNLDRAFGLAPGPP